MARYLVACGQRMVLAGTLLAVSLEGAAAKAATIELVTVGDAGNAADPEVMNDGTTGYGSVPYAYRIGKYEVTNGQYREFLNAKAALGDPYALYNAQMGTPLPPQGDFGGIARHGLGTFEDPYVYLPKNDDPAWDVRPVNYVCWFDAIRFVNWLQNGQGDADTETGTYTILDGGANSGEVIIPTPAERAAWTTLHYVLPTEDEWYKAAYYKGGSLDAGYWDYATQSDEVPDNNPPELDTGNSANCFLDDMWAVGPPYYSTDVGAYVLSPSGYGTFDQTGNMVEWTETAGEGWGRIFRGGAMSFGEASLGSCYRFRNGPGNEALQGGFRVGSIPEPGTLSLSLSAALVLLWYCWAARSKRPSAPRPSMRLACR